MYSTGPTTLTCGTQYDLISDPTYGIEDSALSSTSNTPAHLGRITSNTNTNFWTASPQAGHWIQADFGQHRIVESIRIEGMIKNKMLTLKT